MKRPALQNKQVAVLRMVFGPEKFSGLSRNGPLLMCTLILVSSFVWNVVDDINYLTIGDVGMGAFESAYKGHHIGKSSFLIFSGVFLVSHKISRIN